MSVHTNKAELIYSFAREKFGSEIRSGEIIMPIPHDALDEKRNENAWTAIIQQMQEHGITTVREVTCFRVVEKRDKPDGLISAIEDALHRHAPRVARLLGIPKSPAMVFVEYPTVRYEHARISPLKDRELVHLAHNGRIIKPKSIISMLL